jgi:hypothetical protein
MSRARDKANSTVSNFASTGIDDNADATAITIDSSENVMVGTTSIPTGKLAVEGGIYLTGSSNFLRFGQDSSTLTGIGIHRPSNTSMAFVTSGNERARVTDNGLTFNGDTAAANALDDYEEGSIAGLGVETGTASFSLARYTKIGNLVNVKFFVTTFSDRSTAVSLKVTGLPFTSASSNADTVGSVLSRYITTGDSGNVMANIGSNSTNLFFYATNDGGNWQDVKHSELNNSSAALYVNITYETA